MAKSKKPKQAIFYQNFKGAIYGGTPEQVKNLIAAFCQYAFDSVDYPIVRKHHLSREASPRNE